MQVAFWGTAHTQTHLHTWTHTVTHSSLATWICDIFRFSCAHSGVQTHSKLETGGGEVKRTERFFQLNLWTQVGTLDFSPSLTFSFLSDLSFYISFYSTLVSPLFTQILPINTLFSSSLHLTFLSLPVSFLWTCSGVIYSRGRGSATSVMLFLLATFSQFPSAHRWFPGFFRHTQTFSFFLSSPPLLSFSQWFLAETPTALLLWHLTILSSILSD